MRNRHKSIGWMPQLESGRLHNLRVRAANDDRIFVSRFADMAGGDRPSSCRLSRNFELSETRSLWTYLSDAARGGVNSQ